MIRFLEAWPGLAALRGKVPLPRNIPSSQTTNKQKKNWGRGKGKRKREDNSGAGTSPRCGEDALYKLIYLFQTDVSWLNVFVTSPSGPSFATLSSLVLLFLFGSWYDSEAEGHADWTTHREDRPAEPHGEGGTRPWGGVCSPAVVVSTLLWADIQNVYVCSAR